MTSETPRETSIGEQAANAAQAAAHRARDSVSRVIRARDARDFALGRDRPDLRGRQVYSSDGERVGTVTSMFLDMRTRVIRYIGVSIAATPARGTAEILVPVGWLSRPDDRRAVCVHGLSAAQLRTAPRISRRPVTRGDEHAALAAYGALPSKHVTAQELYDDAMFDERHLFGGHESRVGLS